MSDLTGKQRAFIDAWFGDAKFNAVESARLAGYGNEGSSRGYLRVAAHRVITNDNVQAEIKRRWQTHGITPDEVISQWAQLSRANVADLYTDAGVLDWNKVKDHGELIESIEWLPGSKLKVKLYSKQAALDSIAKTLGMFKDQTTNLNIDLDNLADEQLERIANGEDPAHVLATSGRGETKTTPAAST